MHEPHTPPADAVRVHAKVPFHHCDPLGIVWHGRYLEYFELARTALLARHDLDVPQVRELGYRMLITDARCRYLHPLTYGDELEASAQLTATLPWLRVAYRVWNRSRGRCSARGYTVLATTDSAGSLLPQTPAAILQRLLLCLLLACAPLGHSVAHAQPAHLDAAAPSSAAALLHGLRGLPGIAARFEETKHIALLSRPLVNRGRLYFLPPAMLLRQVDAPTPSRVWVTPTHVHLQQGGQQETIELRSRPQIQPLAASLLWLFAGDQRALEQVYALRFEPPQRPELAWRLLLQPRQPLLRRWLTELRIVGAGWNVQRIEVQEASGDRSVTRITQLDAQRHFSADERRSLFTPPGP